jgi:hypothetical protein
MKDDEEDFEPVPLEIPLFDDPDIEVVFKDILFVLHSLNDRAKDLQVGMSSIDKRLVRLEKALTRITYVPNSFVTLRYDHRTQDLSLGGVYSMHFEGNQAELLSIMFTKSTSMPKRTKFYCVEVAEKLKKKREDLSTSRAVYDAVRRIAERIEKEYNVRGLLTVTTKEFFVNNTR